MVPMDDADKKPPTVDEALANAATVLGDHHTTVDRAEGWMALADRLASRDKGTYGGHQR